VRFVALASGRGSNLKALLEAQNQGSLDGAKIVGLVVNRPRCGALTHAADFKLPSAAVDHTDYPDRAAFEADLLQAVTAMKPDALVLAGFMRIFTAYFLDRIDRPLVNLHPSLLPAFPGAHAIQEAFDQGVQSSGCTTHLVVPEVDAGPRLMQGLVPRKKDDSIDDFRQRMHAMEHRVLPATLAALARGDLHVASGVVHRAEGFDPCLLG
jgi:phosphoribosylglycinamide formyltransferase-1